MSYLYNNNNIGKESVILVDDISSQDITASIADISGSEISYTPLEGAKTVIYEYKFQTDYYPDTNGGIYLELFENTGSGYSGLGNNYCIEYVGNYCQFDNTVHARFILPAYTGSRSYKLRGRTATNNHEITLNIDSNNSQTYYPSVLMTSSF